MKNLFLALSFYICYESKTFSAFQKYFSSHIFILFELCTLLNVSVSVCEKCIKFYLHSNTPLLLTACHEDDDDDVDGTTTSIFCCFFLKTIRTSFHSLSLSLVRNKMEWNRKEGAWSGEWQPN
jgi:hypothetical protein